MTFGFRLRATEPVVAAGYAVAALIVLVRCAVLTYHGQVYFDSDQAVFGLMAKHLAEGRAFPVFMYGQNYLLAVEAWLAAPLVLLLGPTILALRIPLVLVNVAIGLLLLRLLVRDARLPVAAALLASLPFLAPAPGTAAAFLDASGGNVEPLLYVLLFWLFRKRPWLLGATFAVGYLQRHFVVYGLIALLPLLLTDNAPWRSRRWLKYSAAAAASAALVWSGVAWLRLQSSALGPGTSVADLGSQSSNIGEVIARLGFTVPGARAGIEKLVFEHWPTLLGTAPHRLADFSFESASRQGDAYLSLLLVVIAFLGLGCGVMALQRWFRGEEAGGTRQTAIRFPLYLISVGALSAVAYAVTRGAHLSILTMRYDLLSVLGFVGLIAFCLQSDRTWLRALVTLLVLSIGASSALAHVRLGDEYFPHPPRNGKEMIARELLVRGVLRARSDYWMAYHVTYLTGERVVVAATGRTRITEYDRVVQPDAETPVVEISRRPCAGGVPMWVPGMFLCQ